MGRGGGGYYLVRRFMGDWPVAESWVSGQLLCGDGGGQWAWWQEVADR